jgi:hypothetical protein
MIGLRFFRDYQFMGISVNGWSQFQIQCGLERKTRGDTVGHLLLWTVDGNKKNVSVARPSSRYRRNKSVFHWGQLCERTEATRPRRRARYGGGRLRRGNAQLLL